MARRPPRCHRRRHALIRRSSNHWKFWVVLFPIIGACALANFPGGMRGFFAAWYGETSADPYANLLPTAYWFPSRDRNNTDRIALIGNTNTVNTPSTTANGWEFNGTSQYLDMSRPTSLEPGTNAQYSMAAWVQPRGTAFGGVMGKSFTAGGDRWVIYWAASAGKFGGIADESGSATQLDDANTVSTGAWYHVAMTFDRSVSNFFLYRDGIRVASSTTFLASITNPITFAGSVNAPFRFGSYNDGSGNPGNYFSGWIDLAAVWNGRALTSNEVFNLFNDTKAGKK